MRPGQIMPWFSPRPPSTTQTVNAVLAHFSIQNRYMRGTDSANTTTPPTAAAIADAVWDEATAGHTTAGTTGLKLLSAVEEGDLPSEPPAASAIADAVWDEALAGHSGAGSAGSALAAAGAAGISAGAVEFTYTAEDSNSDPLEGVEIWITTDEAGSNLIWYGTSDAFGIARSSSNAKPMLDAGTYYFWSKKGGYTFANPDTVEVTEP